MCPKLWHAPDKFNIVVRTWQQSLIAIKYCSTTTQYHSMSFNIIQQVVNKVQDAEFDNVERC